MSSEVSSRRPSSTGQAVAPGVSKPRSSPPALARLWIPGDPGFPQDAILKPLTPDPIFLLPN